ncbi:MAG: hypothetical protein V3V00_01515 [Saprospiraceae bacterium]
MYDSLKTLLQPEVVWVLIPLVAIIGAFVNKGLKANYKHKERLAKIEAGINPDLD